MSFKVYHITMLGVLLGLLAVLCISTPDPVGIGVLFGAIVGSAITGTVFMVLEGSERSEVRHETVKLRLEHLARKEVIQTGIKGKL